MQGNNLRVVPCTYQVIHVCHGDYQALVRSQASYAQGLVQDLTTPLPATFCKLLLLGADTRTEVQPLPDLSSRLR